MRLADGADERRNGRAQHKIEAELDEEVHTRQGEEHIRQQRGACGPCTERLLEEQHHAEQEHTRVHDRRGDGSQQNGDGIAAERGILPGDEPVDKAGAPAGQRALADADDGTEKRIGKENHVSAVIRTGSGVDVDNKAEHRAEDRTRSRAVEGCADHDGDQRQRDGDRADLDDTAEKLQHHDERGQDGNADHTVDFLMIQGNTSCCRSGLL